MYITQAGEVSGKGFTGGKLLKKGEVEKIDMSDIIPSEHMHDHDLANANEDTNILQPVPIETAAQDLNAACDTTDKD